MIIEICEICGKEYMIQDGRFINPWNNTYICEHCTEEYKQSPFDKIEYDGSIYYDAVRNKLFRIIDKPSEVCRINGMSGIYDIIMFKVAGLCDYYSDCRTTIRREYIDNSYIDEFCVPLTRDNIHLFCEPYYFENYYIGIKVKGGVF